MIWDSSHKYHFFMRREIFTVIFPRCKFPSYRWISPENYPYYGENTFSKKNLQLRENYESYARILQSVPIILKRTLGCMVGGQIFAWLPKSKSVPQFYRFCFNFSHANQKPWGTYWFFTQEFPKWFKIVLNMSLWLIRTCPLFIF